MQNVKEALLVVMSFAMAMDQAKQNDGKVDLKDMPLLLTPMMQMPAAIADAEKILPEWKSATDEQRQELYAWFKSEFDVADDKVEVKVEVAMNLIINAGALLA